MKLLTLPHAQQARTWPASGRVILAQYDAESVIVYQAYRPSIGRFAVEHQRFGGDFQLTRMSWIKPNFLWMMYRSGWGTKPGQDITLAIRLKRSAFDVILAKGVHSTFEAGAYSSREQWQREVKSSDVRLQWDPDHDPSGAPMKRRAIQLGLQGPSLASYATDWILGIEDISGFVAEQRSRIGSPDLLVAAESVYPVSDKSVASRLNLAF